MMLLELYSISAPVTVGCWVVNILGDAIISGTFSASAGSAQTIDATPIVSVSTVEYTVYIENGTNRQAQKVLAMHDGTLAYSQEYGIMHEVDYLFQ